MNPGRKSGSAVQQQVLGAKSPTVPEPDSAVNGNSSDMEVRTPPGRRPPSEPGLPHDSPKAPETSAPHNGFAAHVSGKRWEATRLRRAEGTVAGSSRGEKTLVLAAILC